MDNQEQFNAKLVRMTTDPVERLVIRMAIPTIAIMLISAMYNMADTYFVGQIGTLNAMGYGASVFFWILILQILAPAVLSWVICEYMRKKNWIKFGDMKLDI